MQSKDNIASFNWDEAGAEWQSTSPDHAINLPDIPSPLDRIRGACGKAFACTCGAGTGFLTSHIGCIVSPTLAFLGAASGASVSLVTVGVSTILTGAGLGLWYKTRGHIAGRLEKTLTVGGALTGAVMAASLHLSGAYGHHHNVDEALEWYRGQSEHMQTEIQKNAQMIGMPLNDYVLQICGSPATTDQSPTP